jgi:hypothetical protein
MDTHGCPQAQHSLHSRSVFVRVHVDLARRTIRAGDSSKEKKKELHTVFKARAELGSAVTNSRTEMGWADMPPKEI